MKHAGRAVNYLQILGLLGAIAIIGYVLFQPPQPGVADQGDFDRVMSVSGLQLRTQDLDDPDFDRFLDYTVSSYEITASSPIDVLSRIKAGSITYLITLISLFCQWSGQNVFKTSYLAALYSLMYILALFIIMVSIDIKDHIKLALFIPLALVILLDGNYLVWFNSLYGEPMMITTLSLYIAAWLYHIRLNERPIGTVKPFTSILLIYSAAFLFIGSKLQVFSALPIILFTLGALISANYRWLKLYQTLSLCLLLVVLVIYPLNLQWADREISKYRQYNAVFYGILKDSLHPEQDLADLGLNPDLAVDSGKHAFLDKEAYIKYAPHGQVTADEFYNQVDNGKLVKYYLTHPTRFKHGMEHTVSQAFITSTFLGKYQKKDHGKPVSEFERFTLWSFLREQHLPKNLGFLALIYSVVFMASFREYRRGSTTAGTRARIQLLWAVMLIGLLQFPMPYMGNGAADTYKQLYLFNFVFDLILLVSICWCLGKVVDCCYSPKQSTYNGVKERLAK